MTTEIHWSLIVTMRMQERMRNGIGTERSIKPLVRFFSLVAQKFKIWTHTSLDCATLPLYLLLQQLKCGAPHSVWSSSVHTSSRVDGPSMTRPNSRPTAASCRLSDSPTLRFPATLRISSTSFLTRTSLYMGADIFSARAKCDFYTVRFTCVYN